MLNLFRRTLLLTQDMTLEAAIERSIEQALQQRKQIRMAGFVRPYRRRAA